ncbi:MAG: hypothetical protein H8E48_05065 [Chloroflexi bacterium]|nr:hypothetical protein [Chloroflexota bacterium]
MSAFVVDEKHIRYLVASAEYFGKSDHSTFGWIHEGQRHELTSGTASQAGRMLWNENRESVGFLYSEEWDADDPEFRYEHRPAGPNFVPVLVEIFNACDRYEYQTCEHPGWQYSAARAFLDSLRSRAWHKLPGYRDIETDYRDIDNTSAQEAEERDEFHRTYSAFDPEKEPRQVALDHEGVCLIAKNEGPDQYDTSLMGPGYRPTSMVEHGKEHPDELRDYGWVSGVEVTRLAKEHNVPILWA